LHRFDFPVLDRNFQQLRGWPGKTGKEKPDFDDFFPVETSSVNLSTIITFAIPSQRED
jgi:hypothetical protein